MADEVKVVSLVLDASEYDRSIQASERHTRALGEASDEAAKSIILSGEALRKVAEAAAKASESEQKAGREVQQSAAAWERLRSRLDPAIAGQTAYDRAVQNAERAVRRGHATQEEANRILELARQRYLGIGTAAQAAARAEEEATKARAKAQQSWQGLRESLDPTVAAQSRYARVQGEAEAAVKAGIATQAQANTVIAQARERYLGAAPAVGVFAKAQDEVDRTARGVVARIPLIGGLLSSLNIGAVAAAAGIGLLTFGLTASIAKAAEAERSQLRLEAVLKATGNAAGLSGEQIDRFADDLERGTLAQGEAVKQAASVLAASQSVSGERFKEVIRLAQDYAAVYGGDVVSATQAFAKALEEPERGITMLRRAGIGLSESQQQLIKDFTATGERAKAQQIIIDELRKRIGGAGEAEAGGLAGATHRFGVAWDNMLKRIGNSGPLQLASRLMGTLADEMERVSRYGSAAAAPDGAYSQQNLRDAARLSDSGPRFQQQTSREVYRDLLGRVLTQQQVLGGEEMQRLLDQQLASPGPGGGQAGSNLEYLRSKVAELAREMNPLQEQIRQNQLQQQLLTNAWHAGAIGVDEYHSKIMVLMAAAEKLRTPLQELAKSASDQLDLSGLHPRERLRRQTLKGIEDAAGGKPVDQSEVNKILGNTLGAYDRDQGYQFGRGIQQYDMQAAGLAKVAEAYKVSTAEAEKAELRLRAEIETRDLGSAATERLYKALLKEAEGRKAVEAAKLLADTARQAAEQELLTAALAKGTAEFERTKITIEVARKVQAGYFAEGSEGAKNYAKNLEDLAKAQAEQAILRDTQGLRQQNELLAAELALIGQRPAVIAREIALLKAKQALLNANVDAASEEGQAYLKQVQNNELLTRQLEQARKQQELLMEPFRNFIKGMQDTLGQFFEDVFSGNVKSWKSAFSSIKNLAKQFAIEMLKLLTIQPIINYVMNGFSTGPAGAQGGGIGGIFGSLLGGGTSTGGGGLGGIFGNIFGGGGFGGGASPAGVGGGGGIFGSLFGGGGGLGSFLSRPLHSFGIGTPGLDPTGASAYLGLAESGGLGGFLGNTSIGGALGAVGGFASGISQLISGKGSTSSLIGGISSIVGAGVSLIPGVGQILGPLISIGGGLLGGLFGKKPKIPIKQAQLYTGAPGIQTSGPGTIFQGTDFVHTTPFGVLGYYGTGTNKRFDDPNGEAGDLLRAVADMDRALAELLTQPEIDRVATALQGKPGVGVEWKKAFDNEGFDIVKDRLDVVLRTLYGGNVAKEGLGGIARGNENIEELIERAGEVIQVGNAIKGIGLETTAAEEAIKDINEQFDELAKKAKEYGFAAAEVAKIEAERRRLASKVAGDFNKGVSDAILGIDNPYALAQQQLTESQTERRKEALYLIEQYEKGLIDTLVDINKLEELFGKERVKLAEQYLEQAGSSWKDFLEELTFGPLSGKSNREKWLEAETRFEDVRGRASAAFAADGTLAPALAAEFQEAARLALQYSRAYNASGPDTAALYEQILQLTRQFGNIPGFANGGLAQGLSWVGERGPELRFFRQPTQILSAENSQRLIQTMSGAAANSDVVAALRNLAQGVVAAIKGNNDSLADELQILRTAFQAFLQERAATQTTNAAAGGGSGAAQASGQRRRYARHA